MLEKFFGNASVALRKSFYAGVVCVVGAIIGAIGDTMSIRPLLMSGSMIVVVGIAMGFYAVGYGWVMRLLRLYRAYKSRNSTKTENLK